MRRACLWLAAGAIVFAIYASLLPFALRPQPVGAAWSSFVALLIDPPAGRISRTNFLANVLLFVPVGFALMGARLADRASRPATIALTAVAILVLGIIVSTLVEFAQMFAPGRTPSRLDIAAQILGCGVGIAGWTAAGSALTTWLRDTADSSRADRLTRALMAYGVLWGFVGLAPFDITVDHGELGRRLRTRDINDLA
jgi:VanZ family protein